MKTVLVVIAAAGILLAASLDASAFPANGAAIANIGLQVDPLINVKHKKKKAQAQAQTQAACPADQVRSTKHGNCIPEKSQY
jgi:hypothetical protein